MSLYSFTSLQTCHVCGSHLLGIIQQGYQCKSGWMGGVLEGEEEGWRNGIVMGDRRRSKECDGGGGRKV